MNWLIINYYKNEADTWNVLEEKNKKPRNYVVLFLKLMSFFTYVPTGIHVLKYLLREKDE